METTDQTQTADHNETQDFAIFIAECLSEKLADEIVVLDVGDIVGYCDYFVIASGRNARQLGAMVTHVERRVDDTSGRRAIGREGVREGNWALLDYGDIVVHIFRGEERMFYDLEGLWSEAPKVPFDQDAVAAAPA
ncbi:MAG: ribosome-associated protein [Bradymonadia bacterium]|jgi:ribosome-associated protein